MADKCEVYQEVQEILKIVRRCDLLDHLQAGIILMDNCNVSPDQQIKSMINFLHDAIVTGSR